MSASPAPSRSLRRATALAAAVAGLAAITVAALPSSGHAATTLTFHGVALRLPNDGFVDVDHNGQPTPGDEMIIADTLYDSTGKAVGYDRGTCTIIHVANPDPNAPAGETSCVGTAAVPGGQLTFQAIEKAQDDFVNVAVTGGTGSYTGRQGTLRVDLAQNGTSTWTFALQ